MRTTPQMDEVAAFLLAAQYGSFTQAARRLDVPKSTVSRRVSALERRLELTLMRRSTRSLALTEAGQVFYSRCSGVLTLVEEAEAAVAVLKATPRGLLRVAAPGDFGAAMLGPPVESFLRRYPDIEMQLDCTNTAVDLRGGGCDCAIRVGTLRDDGLKKRQLGLLRGALVAAPTYLARRGVPQHPAELGAHSCLAFTSPGAAPEWLFRRAGEEVRVTVRGALQVNQLPLVKGAALAGLGLARLPTYLCREELASGRLVPVLESWPIEPRVVNLCWLDAGPLPEKLRRFVEHLAEWGRATLDQSTTEPGSARRR